MTPFLLSAFTLVLLLNTANGLECYNCDSATSTSCKWGITSFTYNTEQCTSAGILTDLVGSTCFKITSKMKNGEERIARGCLPLAASLGCRAIAKTVGWLSDVSTSDPQAVSDLNCVTCDTDKCNSASKITSYTILGILLATFAFLF